MVGGGAGGGHVRSGSGGGSVVPENGRMDFGGKDDGHCDKDKGADQDGKVSLGRDLAAAAVEAGIDGGGGGGGGVAAVADSGGGGGGGGATLVAGGGGGAAGGEEKPQVAAVVGGAEPEGAPRDVRSLGTVLIEMVLK